MEVNKSSSGAIDWQGCNANVSGNANNGTNAGAGCVNGNNSAGNANRNISAQVANALI